MRPRSERPRLTITHVNKETQRSRKAVLTRFGRIIVKNWKFQLIVAFQNARRKDTDGTKVSYFKFPTENAMKKKWLHAIRRQDGKHFKFTENTKICSRHFREGDIKKSLAGKNELRDVVPSVFPWIRKSPRKRKNPAERNFELTASKKCITEIVFLSCLC